MGEITVDAASASLNDILDRLSADGQPVVVTREGRPVARVTPSVDDDFPPIDFEKRKRAWEGLMALRKQIALKTTPEEIKSAIEEGRE